MSPESHPKRYYTKAEVDVLIAATIAEAREIDELHVNITEKQLL